MAKVDKFKQRNASKKVKEFLKQNPYIIYSDGGCKGNPGPGGYGVVAIYDNIVVEMSQGYNLTTNNRQEMMGVIAALEEFGPGKHFIICTDSAYTIDGATIWMRNWIRNDWVAFQSGEPVKNADLWKVMDELLKLNKVVFHKVPGHAGDPFNEKADILATAASENPTIDDSGYMASIGA